jgi:hypothetical protein
MAVPFSEDLYCKNLPLLPPPKDGSSELLNLFGNYRTTTFGKRQKLHQLGTSCGLLLLGSQKEGARNVLFNDAVIFWII